METFLALWNDNIILIDDVIRHNMDISLEFMKLQLAIWAVL